MNATGEITIRDEYETELWEGTPLYAEYYCYEHWAIGNNEDYIALAVSSTYAGEFGPVIFVMTIGDYD